MRAAIIRIEADRKVLRIEKVADTPLDSDEVRVRVRAAGICGSDLHGFMDAAGTARREGLIMGHEAAGEIIAVGDTVETVSVGDRVTVDPQIVCGRCPSCLGGRISICDHKRVTGSSLRGFEQGAMAEHLVVASNQVHIIPDTMTFATAAVIEPLANAMHVAARAPLAPGDTVVVLGCGTLGLCMIQAVRARGVATIIATDTSDSRLDLASRLGADVTGNPLRDDIRAMVGERTAGIGADVVIESVGIDTTYNDAIHMVRKRGAVMYFGAVQPTVTTDLLPILHKELTLIGCTGANDETADAIAAVVAGAIDLDALITHTFTLDDAQSAFDTMVDSTSGSVKVLVIP